ncbi:N-alpha-acetyltransferase 30 isoform X1 [Hydra vulgaris]
MIINNIETMSHDITHSCSDSLVNMHEKIVINKEVHVDRITENDISKGGTSLSGDKILDTNQRNIINEPLQMMTLGSNNSFFMTSKVLPEEGIYRSKELPQFLQDSLSESLSKINICDNGDQKTINFVDYHSEECLPDLTALITKDLSEPYSIYTYRYFLHNWPQLSFLAYCGNCCVGAIVCKLDQHRKDVWRGYIAMLAVHKDYRRHKIGSKLVQKSIRRMIEQGCDEVVLETEVTNTGALNLYENLGFVRDKRLLRYYLNGVDAWRLKLWLV